jgi:hypothetical protein
MVLLVSVPILLLFLERLSLLQNQFELLMQLEQQLELQQQGQKKQS